MTTITEASRPPRRSGRWPQALAKLPRRDGLETRSGTGAGPRVVRIGTHGLKNGSRSTLWGRLSQHRGSSRSGLGNHRGSSFRLLVAFSGEATGPAKVIVADHLPV